MVEAASCSRRDSLFIALSRFSEPIEDGLRDFAGRFYDSLLDQELEQVTAADLAADVHALYTFVQASAHQGRGIFVRVRAAHQRTCIDLYGEETPFLLNTLKMHLRARGYPPLLIVDQALSEGLQERYRVALHLQVMAMEDAACRELERGLNALLAQLQRCVADFAAMREVLLRESMEALRRVEAGFEREKNLEFYALISWLLQENMLFLGLERRGEGARRLGYLAVCDDALREALWSQEGQFLHPCLGFAQVAHRSPINHDDFCDVIILRCPDERGQILAEWRLLGLYTSRMHQVDPATIPVMRDTMAQVRELCGFHPLSADARNLDRFLRFLPRERLFLADIKALVPYLRALVARSQRRQVRFLWWQTPSKQMQYVSLFLPKDLYQATAAEDYRQHLQVELAAESVRCKVLISEYLWVRLDYVVVAGRAIDAAMRERLAADWTTGQGVRLARAVDEPPSLFNAAYRSTHTAADMAADLQLWRELWREATGTQVRCQVIDPEQAQVRVSVLHQPQAMWLSEMLPALESMGLRVISETSFSLVDAKSCAYLHELWVQWPTPVDATDLTLIAAALSACWQGRTYVDTFNRLLLAAQLPLQAVQVLRAYAAYMQQIRLPYSQQGVSDVLLRYPELTRQLWQAFVRRLTSREPCFDVTWAQTLAQVGNLHEDAIFRAYAELIAATVRSNALQTPPPVVLAFKLAPQGGLWPLPRPWKEIFVYGPDFEGIHLRFGPLARGGIRWSERCDDYRTEVLGLVKAQQVKNSLIVPVGAKGGFVLRRRDLDPRARQQAGASAYDRFIDALLELTDSLVADQVQHPEGLLCHDADDPYLVVAADKGTANFSDRANARSEAHHFWLGDAFASGGEHGYDHKKMGITARGAMLSLQRHLLLLQRQDRAYTCLGIGDMSGDVFGNGMLLDRKMQLLAAFNHAHIFIDPAPDEAAWTERQRLFALPGSSWNDYDRRRLSPGGAIYARSDKSIDVSEAARQRLDLPATVMTPDALIQALLCAPVDVIWNGGIGTYVKAAAERHADAADPSNDALRVDACRLRASIVCEGGNLGMTQRARVEYALTGGLCYADFIDNSAGVDCSDREVNIKLLLQAPVREGRLTLAQRNALLSSLQDEVAERVLADNRMQAFLLGVAAAQQASRHHEFFDFISYLERYADLDCQLEALPDLRTWQKRLVQEQWLTRPELAILLAYAKNLLKFKLTDLRLADDEICRHELLRAFPASLCRDATEDLFKHPLRHALVATELANDWVHKLGITSLQRLSQRRHVRLALQARAFIEIRRCFALEEIWHDLLDPACRAPEDWADQAQRCARQAVLWLMGEESSIPLSIDVDALLDILLQRPAIAERLAAWQAAGAARPRCQLALEQAVHLLELDYLARTAGVAADRVQALLDQLEEMLGLQQLQQKLQEQTVLNTWQAQAREATIESWRDLRRSLLLQALRCGQILLPEERLREWQGLCARLTPEDYQQPGLYTVLTRLIQGLLEEAGGAD